MQVFTRELKILGLTAAGFFVMFAASALAAGSTQVQAAPTPCITPAGAIYSVNCSGASTSQQQSSGGSTVLGDTTTVPAAAGTPSATPTPTPSLTPGTMPTPETTATPAAGSGGGSGSNLPDTGAVAVSSAIGLSAIGYAGWMYWKRRKMANELVLPRRAPSDPEVLDIAKLNS